jgi:peptide/nickel transport system permease protein
MRPGELMWFVARRLLHAVPLLFCVVVLNFVLIAATPGDPVTILVGDFPAPPGYVEQIRAEFGLDQPIYVQLVRYVGHVLTGDLGYSFANRQPVTTLIFGRLGATLELTLTALVIASTLGVTLGVLAARWRGGWVDGGVQGLASAGYSIPDFWLGQMLILVFSIWLGWLPSQGSMSVRDAPPGFAGFLDHLRYLLLPALALSFRYLSLIARITRAAMLEVLGADFILAARSRGVSERAVMVGHALRNAAAPVITVIGYNLGFILAGSALIETVYGWPGIGRLLFDSISRRDYPVMMAILLMVSATVVLANLATDILHRAIDPRVGNS